MFNLSALTILALLVFWGQIQNYMLRGNLNILIVAMVEPTRRGGNETNPNDSVTMDWDEFDRGVILSAFSYGYMLTQVIGGRLTELYGVKVVYGTSLFMTAMGTFLTPIIAKSSFWGFFALRACMGVFEGVTFPSLIAMTSRWVPPKQRSRFISRSLVGTTFGLIITYPMCGYLAATFGWESAFYATATITVIWFIFWCFFVYDSPEKHPRISVEERECILDEIGDDVNGGTPLPVPWLSIVKSKPYWGLALTDIANSFGLLTFLTNGPTYLMSMLNFDIKSNGMLSSLPMAARYVGGIFFGQMADFIMTRGYMSTKTIRRIFNSISQWSATIGLFVLAFWGEEATIFISVQVTIDTS